MYIMPNDTSPEFMTMCARRRCKQVPKVAATK